MKKLKIYQITEEQFKNTDFSPLGVEADEIETEDGWSYGDVIENMGEGYSVEKAYEAEGFIIWKVYREISYTDGTSEEEEVAYTVEEKN